jgi:membrane protein insertase Oxa1/YidC/SpoIIIJ
MMQWMSLIFPIFLYNYPAGLNLYIVTSTGVGIIESKRIRDHIKQREEAEKEGRVIVEPTRKMRRSGGGGGDDQSQGARKSPKSPKSGGLAGWLADLQQKADEMRQQQKKK